MKKQIKVSSNSKQKEILVDALNSTENEQLDLYKAIFGGADCPVVGVSSQKQRQSAYDKADQFLQAVVG